jgi:hypothetical protein
MLKVIDLFGLGSWHGHPRWQSTTLLLTQLDGCYIVSRN